MARGLGAVLAAAVALGSTGLHAADEADTTRGEKVDGYVEWHLGACVVADAQRVCPASGAKFKGEGEAKSFASIPLGYELKAKGKRQSDGTLLAREVEAKPNGSAMFEGEVKSATDQAEARRGRKAASARTRRPPSASSWRAGRTSTAFATSSTPCSPRTCTPRTYAST